MKRLRSRFRSPRDFGALLSAAGGIPLAGLWQNGIYLDFAALGLGDGTVLTSPITPQVGSVPATPVNSPTIDGVGILGRDAPFVDQALAQYFSAHALAAIVFGSARPSTAVIHCKRDYPTGQRSVFGFGNSAQSTNDFLYGAFPGGASNGPTFVKDAIGEAPKSITRPASVDYDDHVWGFVNTGTEGRIYKDGVLEISGDLNTLALSPNRFVFGARVTTATIEHFGGWIAKVALADQALQLGQMQTVTNAWFSGGLGTPGKADGTKIQFFGDSITEGTSDNDPSIANNTRGGIKYRLYERLRTERMRITMVGERIQGIFANPQHSAIGGLTTSGIRTQINTRIPTYQPKCIFVMAGTNNAVTVESGGAAALAAWRTEFDGMLADARTKLDAYQSDGRIIVANLTPIEPGTPGNLLGDNSNILGMNAQIVAAIGAANAANPTKPPIIFCDFYTAIAPWSLVRFKDSAHPNFTGYNLLGDELWAKAGAYFISIAA